MDAVDMELMRRPLENQMEVFESHGSAPGFEEEEEPAISSTCPSPALEEGTFEGSLWRDLPQDLIDRILAFLPPICLFRLRSVCRRWHSLLNEHGFLCLLSQLPSHGPCFLMARKDGEVWQRAHVYSYPMCVWHSLPLAFIPKKTHSLVASAGGLLCFTGLEGRHDELFVCNPFRQECRRLPDMHHMRQLGFVSMFMDKRAVCYRIVTAGDCGYVGSNRPAIPTEVYDSITNTWAVFHSFPARSLHSLRSAYCNGRLYCLTLSPSTVVAFDIDKGIWESIPVRMPRALLDAFLIAGECGRLLLVGRVGLYSVHQSMRIWELSFVYMDWVEVGRMPHMLFKALLRSSAESFQCFGYGSFICFSAHKQQRWLMHDSVKKTWHWFSNFPLLSNSSWKKVRGFFFEPRLDATLSS
ncbi:hypothetical protein GOP47_0021736 [Adiantum capillus-veneris]|uniref:F-box domain-containing protein n=1 Tax=Adiantum capillus-veneris TaxID=13818 RepID=A0A9D4Z6I2_ADICA|nr:hypothetical protein GOP47_0021736 [Adiantum capillus-veneris]